MTRTVAVLATLLATAALSACGPHRHPAGTTGGGTRYTLDPPRTVNGDPVVSSPSGTARDKMDQGLDAALRLAGVTGDRVTGLYDDSADDAWLVVLGVNGHGFDPARMVAAVKAQPRTRDDGAGDVETVSAQPATAGPHGGGAVCQEVVLRAGGLAVESSTCFWMTSATFGLVTLFPKDDGATNGLGFPATRVDDLMTVVRPQVEKPTS